jgi:HD-GYP domain-containing protein (c-di-GMP phosphodiesterase class II)
MLEAILRALEERDHNLGHGARVAAFAEPVARRLGWEAARLESLRFGAVHHDIGKVVVRSELLRKPGPLTRDELEEVQSHPRAGATLISRYRAVHALPYVLCHHERWDGAGYPSRLRERTIPLEARLLALADAYDAMTSPRPYRRALTHEQALDELGTGGGVQFDPALAALFVEVWSDNATAAVAS